METFDIRTRLSSGTASGRTVFVLHRAKLEGYYFREHLHELRTGRPAIKPAIERRQPDGWYDFGAIEVR